MASVKKTPQKPDEKGSIKAYESALKLLHKGDARKALDAFEKSHAGFEPDSQAAANAEKYVRICRSKLQDISDPNKNAPEELYDRGVYNHNLGAYDTALEWYAKALKATKGGDDSHIQYAIAASHALLNDPDKAVEHLKKAIDADETMRFHARNDRDFEELAAANKSFQELVESEKAD